MKSLFTGCAFTLLIISAHQLTINAQVTQSRCNMTEATAPVVRGVRLGMTAQELLSLFPGSSERAEIKEAFDKAKPSSGNETMHLHFEPEIYSTKENFKQVDQILAIIHKGRVASFTVVYDGPPYGPTWRSADEWVAKLSEGFRLPAAQSWTLKMEENPTKVLKCGGVEIEAVVGGGAGSLTVRSVDYLKQMEPTSEEQEKKRREFKPQ